VQIACFQFLVAHHFGAHHGKDKKEKAAEYQKSPALLVRPHEKAALRQESQVFKKPKAVLQTKADRAPAAGIQKPDFEQASKFADRSDGSAACSFAKGARIAEFI